MNRDIIRKLSQFGDCDTDVSFQTLTTFRVGGNAAVVCYPKNEFSLISILDILKDENIPFKVLGNGSNILPSDDDYDGAVIKLNRFFNQYYFDEEYLNAEGGCSLITLAVKALDQNLSGLEFASGIPGSLAGAIYMNAGAYKCEMKDIVESVRVLIKDEVVALTGEECQFAYRSSIFQSRPDWIILGARLKLTQGDHEEIQQVMKKRQKRRLETQPLEWPSAGSTFRNPETAASWQLIDGIGYRGKMIGGAQVSEKHSNFIINVNKATASDIDKLAKEIMEKVEEKYGVQLVMEVERFNWKN